MPKLLYKWSWVDVKDNSVLLTLVLRRIFQECIAPKSLEINQATCI